MKFYLILVLLFSGLQLACQPAKTDKKPNPGTEAKAEQPGVSSESSPADQETTAKLVGKWSAEEDNVEGHMMLIMDFKADGSLSSKMMVKGMEGNAQEDSGHWRVTKNRLEVWDESLKPGEGSVNEIIWKGPDAFLMVGGDAMEVEFKRYKE